MAKEWNEEPEPAAPAAPAEAPAPAQTDSQELLRRFNEMMRQNPPPTTRPAWPDRRIGQPIWEVPFVGDDTYSTDSASGARRFSGLLNAVSSTRNDGTSAQSSDAYNVMHEENTD